MKKITNVVKLGLMICGALYIAEKLGYKVHVEIEEIHQEHDNKFDYRVRNDDNLFDGYIYRKQRDDTWNKHRI